MAIVSTMNQTVIIELKAVDEVSPIHEASLLSYLKLSVSRSAF